MSLIEHAKKELEIIGLFDKDSDYDGMLAESVMELIHVFSNQGHSGEAAGIVSDLFGKLSRFEPISPLTGEDEEYIEVGPEVYQNKRNCAVFKKGRDGRAYFIDALAKRTPDGNICDGSLELKDGRTIVRCYIKDFSNIPTIIIDVVEEEVEKGNWKTWVEDEGQLEELAKYYDFEIFTL